MIKTYIIGTGYFSSKILKGIKNSQIASPKSFISNIHKIKNLKKFNLIINAFYSVRKLNNFVSYKFFVEKSLLNISEILDVVNPKLVNKIIYTSSSSVYGSLNSKLNIPDRNNRYIYSSFKISAENLIKNFCNKKKINFDICRVFNLYGLNDNFSIISKLINLKKNHKNIRIFNNGESVRDFIHVNDVVMIYKKLLTRKDSNIYDVGTGKGTKIKDIISAFKFSKNNIVFVKNKTYEIDTSIANNSNLLKKVKFKNFKKLENFLKIKKLNYSVEKSKSNYLENTLIGSIIYGAGFSGKELYKQFCKYDDNIVSYFVDDDPIKVGKKIDNLKILSHQELKELSKKINIRNIIVAIPSLTKKKRSNLFKRFYP